MVVAWNLGFLICNYNNASVKILIVFLRDFLRHWWNWSWYIFKKWKTKFYRSPKLIVLQIFMDDTKRNTSDVESASGLYRSNTFFKKGRPACCSSRCTRSSRRQASFTMNRRAKTRFLLPSHRSIEIILQIELLGVMLSVPSLILNWFQ